MTSQRLFRAHQPSGSKEAPRMLDSRETVINENYTSLDLDDIIKRLTTRGNQINRHEFILTYNETKSLFFKFRQILSNEDICLKLNAPINIVGDIHGQFNDLLRLFNRVGQIPTSRYLFLGDYVDRGLNGLECLSLLIAYKIKFPDHIYLLRGNHESEMISRFYGFRQECIEKFGNARLWKYIIRSCGFLPFAAVLEDSIFCCHGGISPVFLNKRFSTLNDIFKHYKKPIYSVPESGVLCDLVWADPTEKVRPNQRTVGWKVNPRGISWEFGDDIIDSFLKKYNLDLIVRGHQVVDDGYEFTNNRKLLTLFSAPRYCGTFDNAGAILSIQPVPPDAKITERWIAKFHILKPEFQQPNQWFPMTGFQ